MKSSKGANINAIDIMSQALLAISDASESDLGAVSHLYSGGKVIGAGQLKVWH